MNVRIMLVDDHEIVRDGLRFVLQHQPGFEVVGEAATGPAALKLAQDLKPDLILMDLGMGEMSGIDVSRDVLTLLPDTKVIIFSGHAEPELIHQALGAGVHGYLLKSSASADLLQAIRAVIGGQAYFCSGTASTVAANYRKLSKTKSLGSAPKLSDRETEVLRLVAEGLRTKEIADRLNISLKTVEGHRANLMTKLNCSGMVELTRYALREGIISL